MKFIFVLFVSLFATHSQAAEVVSAKISGGDLIVTVRHGGGCGDHKYDLQMQGCAESMPVQCKAVLKHTTNDHCEALLTREAKFNLVKLGIKGDYYSNGSLTISGSNDTSATVRLPSNDSSDNDDSAADGKKIECVTHTGSILIINPAKKTINLETTAGVKEDYRIVGTDMRVLESMPPIYQNFYKMHDGRSVVTEFRSSQKTGSGFFIRLNGEYSPEFKSCRK